MAAKGYRVQSKKGAKSRYVTRYDFVVGEMYPLGNGRMVDAFDAALFYFSAINVGNGFRKRLLRVNESGSTSIISCVTS